MGEKKMSVVRVKIRDSQVTRICFIYTPKDNGKMNMVYQTSLIIDEIFQVK